MDSENSFMKDVAVSMAEGLASLRSTDSLTDITIRVQSQTFRCHKAVLASVSPFFRVMFMSEFKEKMETEIDLKELSSEAFEVILSLIYAEKDSLTEDNVEIVFNAAVMFQIDCIIKRCADFFIRQLSCENCIHVWQLGRFHSCANMEIKAFEQILKNFTEISDSNRFLELNDEEIIQIISKNDLNVLSEEIVFEAVVRWIRKDLRCRNDRLFEVLRHIRFPIMRARYLQQMIRSIPNFENNPEVARLFTKGMSLMSIPESRLASSEETSFHRSQMEQIDGYIAGQFSHPDGSKRILMYDFGTGNLCCSPRLGGITKISDAMYTNGRIFILGTVPRKDPELFMIDLSHVDLVRKVQATYVSEFNFSAKAFMMPIDDGIFFATRESRDSRSVRYNFSTQCFTLGSAVPSMGDVQAAVIAQYIYMFCNIETESNCIFKCNPVTDSISKIGNLTHPVPFKKVMVEDDIMYVLFEDGNIWKLSDNENGELAQEFFLQIPDFALSKFSSVIHLSKMYFFSSDMNISVFDLKSGDLLELETKVPKHLSCRYFCKATIPRSFMDTNVEKLGDR